MAHVNGNWLQWILDNTIKLRNWYLECRIIPLPCDNFIVDGEEKSEYGHEISDAVTNKRPPIQIDDTSGKEGAHADNKHDIEDGRANHATDTYVIL